MSEVIRKFFSSNPDPWPDEIYGNGQRCSVTLKDGTFLPCVIIRDSAKYVDLALRRFEEEKKGKGVFQLKGKNAYREIVKSFVTSGNRINEYDVAEVTVSRFSFPVTLLKQLRGETTMSWTGFVLEMDDGELFQYGTTFSVEFFNLPEGYEFSSVKTLHNHSFLREGKLASHKDGFSSQPEKYDHSITYRERPHFVCYTGGL